MAQSKRVSCWHARPCSLAISIAIYRLKLKAAASVAISWCLTAVYHGTTRWIDVKISYDHPKSHIRIYALGGCPWQRRIQTWRNSIYLRETLIVHNQPQLWERYDGKWASVIGFEVTWRTLRNQFRLHPPGFISWLEQKTRKRIPKKEWDL